MLISDILERNFSVILLLDCRLYDGARKPLVYIVDFFKGDLLLKNLIILESKVIFPKKFMMILDYMMVPEKHWFNCVDFFIGDLLLKNLYFRI